MSSKQEYPRSFYFKLHEVFCKTLDVTRLCYGRVKNKEIECIYGIDTLGVKCRLRNDKRQCLQLSKSRENDMLKEIVKRIMKELEVSNVFIFDRPWWVAADHIIYKNTCCEKLVVEYDMNTAIEQPYLKSSDR